MTTDTLRVNYDELEITQDALLMLYQGEPFTGAGYEENEQGQLIAEVSFVNGLREGKTRIYFPSGQLRSEAQIYQATGLSQSWYENGQLEIEKTIEHGVLVRERQWDENGNLMSDYELGENDSMYQLLLLRRKDASKGHLQGNR